MGRYLNPVLIIGSLLAVGAGILTYFFSERDVALGVVVALQIQILTIATETLLAVKGRTALAGRLAQLLGEVELVPWLSPILQQICDAAIQVHTHYGATIAPAAAERVLSIAERELRQLELGTLYVDCYDPTLKLQLLLGPATTLRAVSVQSHDLRWHLSGVGRNYWSAQLVALSKGWEIRRIFVYREWSEELRSLAEEQKAAGMIVMRVHEDALPGELRGFDVTIWGERHAFEHQRMQLGTTTVDKFTVNSRDIAEYRAKFATLEVLSERI